MQASPAYMLFALILSITLIVFLVTKMKTNAAISLVIGSLLLGFMTGMPFLSSVAADGSNVTGIVDAINNGFGSMMTGIGFPIGFGIILGQFVSDSGGASVIADKLVSAVPEKYALFAVAFAGFILSIPVFFDVTFVILIPIGVALMNKLHKGIAYIIGCISIGAAVAHTLVPPTPNPLVAPEYFGFDLGIMIAAGILFGIPIVLLSTIIYIKILDHGFWKSEKDESSQGMQLKELELPEKLPSFAVSMLPIIIPIVLILLNTILGANGNAPMIIQFIGTKTMSMLIGALVGMVICIKYCGFKKTEEIATKSLSSAGIVFLITGAGGSFSAVISACGVNDAIRNLVTSVDASPIIILLLCWALGLVFREITGSGTVASLSTFAIMQSVAATLPIHPVFIALACLSGAMFGATVNDSGFWIVTNMSGLNFSGGVKTYTVGEMISSVIGIVLIIMVASLTMLFR